MVVADPPEARGARAPAGRVTPRRPGADAEDVLPRRAGEDTDRAWGDWRENAETDDEHLLRERPPHWG
jgi:hypothetical protein